ncbi:hypothetical protein CWB76_01940 [Pseudoalteromonas sp. S1609]|uniref:hypothetical protein n=1 Tax=Pseudoalteromonas sp. S1609 TaxID=579505 RepID=UPI00110AB268|nr:hypothetical protein [Pseudoalteromonas sp. S1609]TMP72735.1 hypothetical protein CWB76_01940 [Pseudoalteromonas sp. S1609]
MSRKVVFTLNENIADRHGKKWKISGFVFSNKKVELKCQKGSETQNFNIVAARDNRNKALIPGKKYLLTVGTSESKFAIELKEQGVTSDNFIIIEGNKACDRIIQKIPVSSISLKIFCGTLKEFDQLPETIEIREGDLIKIREDHGAWHSEGKVEKSGDAGIVTSINKGRKFFSDMTTIDVDFNGTRKSYSLHRVISKEGFSMCYGWQYMATNKFGVLKISPVQPIEEGKLSWGDYRG